MGELMGGIVGLVFMSIPIVWIVMHYRAKIAAGTGFTEEDARQLAELMEIADTMAERIKTLESILDVETPEWRDHHDEK